MNVENDRGNCMENCCHKIKKRTEDDQKALLNRLSRIEGQVRGVKNMVENDAYCVDVLLQVSAIRSALASFQSELLSDHIKTCVSDDLKSGKTETVDELVQALKKMR